MQAKPNIFILKDPSAASIVVGSGDFAGEVYLDNNRIRFLAASVSSCGIVCAKPCTGDVWEIQFKDVDFGDCNTCGKSIGFSVALDRNNLFDNATYFDWTRKYPYIYGGLKQGTVTGATLAAYFVQLSKDIAKYADQHDQFFVDMSVKVGSPDTIVLRLPCDGLVTYKYQGIYQIEDNNLTSLELPVFTNVVVGQDAVLSREKLLRDFPQEIGHVFGEGPRDEFFWCDDICIVTLKGCIDPCSDFANNMNSNHLWKSATPFDVHVYVNTKAPGWPDFVAALNAAFPSCQALNSGAGLSSAPGMNGECYQANISGGSSSINITNIVFDGADYYFTLNNGVTKLTVQANDAASLVAALTAAFPSGTFAYAAPNVVVSGTFASTATVSAITLCKLGRYRNYAGE